MSVMDSPGIRVAAAVALVATAVTLSSCSTSTGSDRGAVSTTTGQPAAYDADDVMFAQSMIPHHEQALELAALVPDRSTDPAVIALAARIAAEQQPEISGMKALLLQWAVDPNEAAHGSGHAGMAMAGMVDDATMAKLGTLTGAEFDALWLQSMINHHRGAIEMARVEIANGRNADMITMARNIASAQQAEVDQMTPMLAGIGG
jgi:uncharacterized protein (DUF305 family)